MASLAKRDPHHVLLSVFAPLTYRHIDELRQEAGAHYRRLKEAAIETAGKGGLLEAFESWLMARFKNSAEVKAMIVDIPPIEKSAAARYFRQQGQEIGEKRGLKRGVKRGVKAGEKKAIRAQMTRLRKLEKDIPPQVYYKLTSSLQTRLAQLEDEEK